MMRGSRLFSTYPRKSYASSDIFISPLPIRTKKLPDTQSSHVMLRTEHLQTRGGKQKQYGSKQEIYLYLSWCALEKWFYLPPFLQIYFYIKAGDTLNVEECYWTPWFGFERSDLYTTWTVWLSRRNSWYLFFWEWKNLTALELFGMMLIQSGLLIPKPAQWKKSITGKYHPECRTLIWKRWPVALFDFLPANTVFGCRIIVCREKISENEDDLEVSLVCCGKQKFKSNDSDTTGLWKRIFHPMFHSGIGIGNFLILTPGGVWLPVPPLKLEIEFIPLPPAFQQQFDLFIKDLTRGKLRDTAFSLCGKPKQLERYRAYLMI